MKWVFMVLVVVNLSLAVFQWLQHRESKVVPVYQDVAGISELVLLSELSEASDGKEMKLGRCNIVGPFRERKLAEEFERQLESAIQKSVFEQKIEKAPAYWVYTASGDTWEKKMADIKAIGIDSYRISKGALAGNLSLGVFDNIDLARGLEKKLGGLGFDVNISEKKRFDREFWVQLPNDYAAENAQKIQAKVALLSKGVNMREIFCKSVASEK